MIYYSVVPKNGHHMQSKFEYAVPPKIQKDRPNFKEPTKLLGQHFFSDDYSIYFA
jgi:hypothetical protein